MFETGHLAECRVVTRGHIPKLQSLRISETFPNFQHISSVGSMFFSSNIILAQPKASQKKHNVFIHVFQPEMSGASIPSVRQKYGFGRRRAHEFEALAFAADTAVPREKHGELSVEERLQRKGPHRMVGLIFPPQMGLRFLPKVQGFQKY